MSKVDINTGIELLINKIKADIEFSNYINPEYPLTLEDVINKLVSKTNIKDVQTKSILPVGSSKTRS